MGEKSGIVKNPLSVIAIFAGIAEVGGTIVLPFLEKDNQFIYMWFLMLFPTLLVLLFFGVLIFKVSVLYAPSDYRDEKNFLNALTRANHHDVSQKLALESEQLVEAEALFENVVSAGENPVQGDEKSIVGMKIRNSQDSGSSIINAELDQNTKGMIDKVASLKMNLMRVYPIYEDIILASMESLFSSSIQREMKYRSSPRGGFVFDGVAYDGDTVNVIEIKVSKKTPPKSYIRQFLERTGMNALSLTEGNNLKLNVILALAVDSRYANFEKIKIYFDEVKKTLPFNSELKIFDINKFDIEDQYKL